MLKGGNLKAEIEPGYGLIDHGACAVKFDLCPICMQYLNETLYFLFWEKLDMTILDHKIKLCFVFIHEDCDERTKPAEQVCDNIIRLAHEFGTRIFI